MIAPVALGLLWALQTPAAVKLPAAEATLRHEFIQIRGLVELKDGRVLVTDRLDELVAVADFASGSFTPIGRVGGGPEEYRLPASLIPVPGDSVLLIDEGNNRLVLIGPDLRIKRTMARQTPELPDALWPRGVDPSGRHYALVPGWIMFARGMASDSLPIVRFQPTGTKLETLAWLHPSPDPPPPPRRDRPRIPMVVFAAGDAWAPGPNGRIAIVRAKDYRVEWIDSAGRRTVGPPVRWSPVPVTTRDRTEYTRRFLATSGIGGKGGGDRPPGGLVATPAELMTDAKVAELADNTAFAKVKAPFTDVTPKVGPDGTLWVERSMPAGSPARWDVFDQGGAWTGQVELPAGRRLVALGAGTVYLAAVNEDGVERLERYRR
jgi:hypothetical protein